MGIFSLRKPHREVRDHLKNPHRTVGDFWSKTPYILSAGLLDRSNGARTFVYAWVILASFQSIAAVVTNRKKTNLQTLRDKWLETSTIKASLVPALLPAVYARLRRVTTEHTADQHARTYVPPLFSALTLLLLPPSWRLQIAAYAASVAIFHVHAGKSSQAPRKIGYVKLFKLPPIWTLNVVGNAWLIWAFLFMSDAFPRAYERVILSHSSHYVPNDMSKKHLERFLSSTDFPVLRRPPSKLSDSQSISAGQDETHSNSNMHVVCRTLHPREPSCFKNYVNALLYESRKVWKWVGAFGALSIALRYRGEVLRRPGKLARQWLVSTARGTAFVVGNITTSWYLTCLMQQILPPGMFVNSRWLVNGALSSLWILVLPPKRRDEIALYVGRLAALSMWRAYRLKGGPHLPYGEVVIFGTAWAHLSESMRTGEKVGGLMGLGIAEVERKR